MSRLSVEAAITTRNEAASDWARRVDRIYDFELSRGNVKPEIAAEMIAEHYDMASLAEYALAQLGLILIPEETDVETGEVNYSIDTRRNYREARNG